MNKQIIINSDDFGLTRGVNYGILDAFLNNSISATSLMVNTPATKHAVALMNKYNLPVGIHVNITLGKPVSNPQDIPSLLNEDGCFHGNNYYLEGNRVNQDELINEFDQQIQLFIKLTGKEPDHINYHHIYDFYNEYPKLFEFLINKYHKPMRLEAVVNNYPYQYVKKEDLFMNFENKPLQDYLVANIIEVPCHIGYVDHELMEISSLNMQRVEDSYLANSKEFKELYTKLGYKLTGWKEVKIK